jgi:hypothetical protein
MESNPQRKNGSFVCRWRFPERCNPPILHGPLQSAAGLVSIWLFKIVGGIRFSGLFRLRLAKNYLVNKSNGSRWINTGIANAFSRLPVVRGEFDAVAVAKSFITSKAYQSKDNAGSTEYRKDSSREIAGNL